MFTIFDSKICHQNLFISMHQYLGDLMVILRSMGGASHAMKKSGLKGLQEYCDKTGLHQKSILEAWKLNNQLINQLNMNVPSLKLDINPDMIPPTPIQVYIFNHFGFFFNCRILFI